MDPGIVFRPDQIEDLGWHLANPRGILGHDPGVGKTPIACLLAAARWEEQGYKTVWPQPRSLLRKNARELRKFTDFKPEDIEILSTDRAPITRAWSGPTFTRTKRNGDTEVCADLIAASKAKVFLCGYRFWTMHWERMLQAHPEIKQCIVDEAHKAYGGNESQATLELYQAMRHIPYFVPMTATLLDGALDSVFPIVHLIEPRYYGSYNGFLEQHAGYIDNYGKVTRWQNLPKVLTILDRHSTKRTFTETYGPEAVVFFHEVVEMSEEHRKPYNEFHDLAMLELEDGRVLDGALPGVATIRARQILGHPETLGFDVPNNKDERLELYAAERGSLVVFSVHVPEQQRLVKVLAAAGRKVGLINGSVTGNDRAKIDAAFIAGELDALVASPECCAEGFNWGHAEHIVFVSLSYSDVTFFQAYRRGLRGKRTTPLRVTTLSYENTIDQRVQKILVDKSKLANEVDSNRAVLSFSS